MHAFSDPFALPLSGDGLNRPAPLVEDLQALSRFRSKMSEHEMPVNVARMMFDRDYAFERIALAHSSADESLQRMALALFALYAKPGDTTH